VKDQSKLGKNDLSRKDIHVQIGTVLQQDVNENVIEEFAINSHSLWEPFNYNRQMWKASITG